MEELLDERSLSRLRWRCRRAFLEKELYNQRIFMRFEGSLARRQGEALSELMELADNDLLDLLLARTEPQGELARPDVKQLLALLRNVPN